MACGRRCRIYWWPMALNVLLLALAFHSAPFVPDRTRRPSPSCIRVCFGFSVVTGVLFGTVPAWFATRTNPVEAIRGAGRSTGDRSAFSRKALIVCSGHLSVVLVAGAAMLARSLNNLEHQDFGIQTANRICGHS